MRAPETPETQLLQGARAILGEHLSDQQRDLFRVYQDILREWNSVHRLVGSSEPMWLVRNVLLDSLLFLRVLPASFDSLLDIGSGAGIPGIPVKIVRPGADLVMVESRRRRASFLSATVRRLGLSGASVVHGRAEAMIEGERRFDAVVARCAGELSAILDLGSRLVRVGGVVAVAGPPVEGEVPGARIVKVQNPATGTTRSFMVLEP